MSQENVEIVRAIYDEFEKGNLSAGLDLYDPDVMFIPHRDVPDVGRHSRYIGQEGIREFMREWLGAWTEFTITGDEFIEAGESVVVAERWRGVGRESGIVTELSYFHIWTFRGKAIIRMQQFGDRAEALEAAGLSE